MERPDGIPVADHVYGGTPPVAVSVWLKFCPAVAPGKGDGVVIARAAGVTTTVIVLVAESPELSVTLTVNV
jgi:hypothetical protein